MEMEELESILKILVYILGAIGITGLVVRWIWLERFISRNSKANVQTCGAVAYYKDPETGYLPQGQASSSVHYITFHTDDGDIVNLYMGPRDFYAIEEGSRGILTWQGQRFWKFQQ